MFNFLIVCIISVNCGEATDRFPNTKYLGMGYNAVKGNPENNVHDPGFSSSVLRFTWSTGGTTSDGKYTVPDHVQVLQTKSCGFQSDASLEFGSSSYQKAISGDVSVEAGGGKGIWKARFTASTGYQTISDRITQHRCFHSSARAKCIQYQLSVNIHDQNIEVTTDFARAVSDLPLTRVDSAYHKFLNTYGTHFTSQVWMGAKMFIRSEFYEPAATNMEMKELNVEALTKLSFRRIVGDVLLTETKKEKEQIEAFERNRNSINESYWGAKPQKNSTWETWAKSAGNSPYPVWYKLVPLTALFTKKFFPDSSPDNLKKKRDLLDSAYISYCDGIAGCGTPPEDRTIVRMMMAVSRFVYNVIVSCPPTYNLISCGILNVKTSGKHDMQRYAIPHGNNSCYCKDKQGAKCVSWCTTAAVQYKMVETDEDLGYEKPNVSCPTGYKVCRVFTSDYSGIKV